jgi:hypothetical protein
VFLALANVKPNEAWEVATAPLLPTYVIMDFIRNHYGKDYKHNSRETIRRQTLHQFEQARIIAAGELGVRTLPHPSNHPASALISFFRVSYSKIIS